MHIYQTSKVKCNLRDSNLRDAAHIEITWMTKFTVWISVGKGFGVFSVHLNTTVCLTSCAFVFGLKKKSDFCVLVIIDASYFVAYHLFYEDFKGSVVFKA